MTVQELAERADVTKGLISQIVIEGEIVYRFDGRLSHAPVNLSCSEAIMLVVYFFD